MKAVPPFYPNGDIGANPIHAVTDWRKVRSIARALLRGDAVPPFVIEGQRGSCNLLSGTHRAAANDLLAMLGRPQRAEHETLDSLENPYIDEIREAADESDYERLDSILDR